MQLVLKHLLLFLCFTASIYGYTVSGLNSDGITLLALLRHWTSVPSSITSSWNASDSSPCSWAGVQCDNAHNVMSLNLSSQAISGRLGPEIGHLSQLQILDLSYNNFFGVIPKELGNCSVLEELDLSVNNFSGEIPDRFENLQSLLSLSLYENMLIGEIPESVFRIAHLEYVYLNN